ncbi:hypothetical protein MKEN_01218000 [Mycena kentingensis (nom. inval.)]|nr:hypothetical protein MKEN_01218000 [Mycena kentingensis (nom. inval.)]
MSLAETFVASALQLFKEQCTEDVRARLEYAWGLELGGLDAHFGTFPETEDLFERTRGAFLIPDAVCITALWGRDPFATCQQPNVMTAYKTTVFTYILISQDSPSSISLIQSTVPPHMIIPHNVLKMQKAGGNLSFGDDDFCTDLRQRIQTALPNRPAPAPIHFPRMWSLSLIWVCLQVVPSWFSTGQPPPPPPPKPKHFVQLPVVQVPRRRAISMTDFESDEEDTDGTWLERVREWVKDTSCKAEKPVPLGINTNNAHDPPRPIASVDFNKRAFHSRPRWRV